MKDPLALWRTKDPLSLSEAGALVCDVPPSRTYPHKLPEFTAEMRAERDAVNAARVALKADAQAGKLPAVLKLKQSGGKRKDRSFLGGYRYDPDDEFEPVDRWIDLGDSTVTRSDLEAWCIARGIHPAVFAPSPAETVQAEAETGDLPEYVADKISALRFAWRKHWANAEPKDGATWPKQGAVEQTLKQRGIGSDRICAAVATMIRPPWAKGRPPTGEQ